MVAGALSPRDGPLMHWSAAPATLGESLATVRRIEGVLLHPTRDAARGVHRFDDGEVETLAEQVKQGRVQLSQELSPTNGEARAFGFREPCENCLHLERRVAALLEQLDEQRRHHDLELRQLSTGALGSRSGIARTHRTGY